MKIDRILLSKTFVIIFSLILIQTIPQSFADYFMDFPIRVKHSPTICALEPQPDPSHALLSKVMFDETNYAIMDWNNKINQGYGKHPVWNIKEIEVPLSKQSNFDYSVCDISINYLARPDVNSGFVAMGLTIPNFETGKTRIEIYYSGVEIGSKMITWAADNKIYYTYVDVPVYTGDIETEPQLAGIIRHEIGHSLGLGHYLVSPDERHNIVTGLMDMPSIMIDTITVLGVLHYDITPLDINEIKSIYGQDGFNGGISSQNFKKASILSLDISNYPSAPVTVNIDTSYFGDNEVAALQTLDPDGRLIGIVGLTKDNSTLYIATNSNSGKYYVELIDYSKDVYDYTSFTLSGGKAAVSELGGNTQPAPVESAPQTQLVAKPIPSWIKNNAKWWSESQVGDNDFVKGIQYLVQQGIITIPQTQSSSSLSKQIPSWIKNDASWWASGQVSDDEFVKGIQYLISVGIIQTQ